MPSTSKKESPLFVEEASDQSWYYKKMDNMQKECISRLRDGAPEVDANRKPFSSVKSKPGGHPNRVHVIKEMEGHISSYAAAPFHAVQEMRSDYLNIFDHFNWS